MHFINIYLSGFFINSPFISWNYLLLYYSFVKNFLFIFKICAKFLLVFFNLLRFVISWVVFLNSVIKHYEFRSLDCFSIIFYDCHLVGSLKSDWLLAYLYLFLWKLVALCYYRSCLFWIRFWLIISLWSYYQIFSLLNILCLSDNQYNINMC